jgi:hypothetical protein
VCLDYERRIINATRTKVQIKKDYYKDYHKALETLLLKAPEFEILSRFPENEWVSVRKECYPGRS